jgi:hypothetical protein
MANSLYDNGRESFLRGEISWNTDDIKVALADAADYTPSLSGDQFLDDIPGAAIEATSANLAAKSTTAGVADAGDFTFSAVTGDECEYLVIYQDSGVASTSRLIGLIDTATNLPVTPNGGDIDVTWDNGANRIFKL